LLVLLVNGDMAREAIDNLVGTTRQGLGDAAKNPIFGRIRVTA
jgi:hypothetical protein